EPENAPVATAPRDSEDGVAVGDDGMELGLPGSPEDDTGDGGLDELAFDPERFSRAGQAADAPAGIEEFLAAQANQGSDEVAVDDLATAGTAAADAGDPPLAGSTVRE